jgi:BolA family transcriptional regulator, general stress-responsive regulator
MGPVQQEMTDRLQKKLNPTTLEVINESPKHQGHLDPSLGAETHFRIHISSPMLTDLSKVQAHRKVYEAIGDLMDNPIHALSVMIV